MDGSRARAVLGVAEHASSADLRRAFRRRSLASHPDRGGDADAFDEIVRAFSTLDAIAPPVHELPARMLVSARAGVDCYDSPARPLPSRDFADVLRVACSRWSSGS
jgi:DnaJ family protein A protein 2